MTIHSRPHVALATCAALAALDEDDRRLIPPLEARGARVSAVVWDDPTVDWDEFDLVVVRSTWDYTTRRSDFLAWAHKVPRLANPATVIDWNTDKRYLAELAAAGLPVVPTAWLAPGERVDLPRDGVYVIKPSIGAGSLDAERHDLSDPADAMQARRHVDRLLEAGQLVMVQPYVDSVDDRGETGVVLLRGEFSHAIAKSAMLGDQTREAIAGLYKAETIEPREPSRAELDLALTAVRPVPGAHPTELTYARVDLVAGDDGEPLIIELELTEPSLFMATAPGSEERFASAIMDTIRTK